MPEDMLSGDYMLQAAITGRSDDKPAIKLANDGRGPDGWYDVGRVIIK
jgi:hypothetical protein